MSLLMLVRVAVAVYVGPHAVDNERLWLGVHLLLDGVPDDSGVEEGERRYDALGDGRRHRLGPGNWRWQ